MKTQKIATVLAAAAAGLALTFAAAVPANATPQYYGGTLTCPSNKIAQVTFTTSAAGYLSFYSKKLPGGYTKNSFIKLSYLKTYTYKAKASGPVTYEIMLDLPAYQNLTRWATCV